MTHGGQLHFHKCNHIFVNGLVDTFCYSTRKEVQSYLCREAISLGNVHYFHYPIFHTTNFSVKPFMKQYGQIHFKFSVIL